MTTSVDGILGLQSINLTPFETRGAKPGTGNSRTTGPVYTEYVFTFGGSGQLNTGSSILSGISLNSPYNFFNATNLAENDLVIDGTYSYTIGSIIDSSSVSLNQSALSTGNHSLTFQRSFAPASNIITGIGQFDSTDSSAVTAVSVSSPYAFLTAKDLTSNDVVIDGTNSYTITSVIDATSFFVDKNALSTGTHPLVFQLTQREYLIEPDAGNNDVLGDASFTSGGLTVTGIGTSWLSELAHGDFIQHDGHMDTFAVQSVGSNTQLTLDRAYTGDTTVGAYTASRVAIGRTKVHFVKNNFSFDNQAGRWTYDTTTGGDVTTSSVFMPFTDGMTLRYTPAYNIENPGLMMTKSVYRKTFARQTQYEMDFFPLPVVPDPEASVELLINNVLKDRYPVGHRDYVLNYSSNPIYETPPPPNQRKICSIMFLNGIHNKVLDQIATEDGQIQLLDNAGQNINSLMPGSVSLLFDGTRQTEIKDYVLEPNAGLVENVDYTVNEQLVKYVAVDYSKLIDYGFNVFLNGQPQQFTVPPLPSDDIIFQPRTGRMKPQNQDKPGPNDVYQFNYQVDGDMIKNEIVPTKVGATTFRLNRWPVKSNSVFLIRNGVILTEEEDYTVLYQTGNVILTVPMALQDSFNATYVPLSKQINDLTYDSSSMTWFCTSHDSRSVVVSAHNYQFSLLNPNVSLDASTSSLLRVYNETRQKDYNLAGASLSKQSIVLAQDATNTSVGLASSDTVLVDYKFASEVLEYTPVTINTYVIPGGANTIYLEGVDAVSNFPAGAVLRLAAPDSLNQYYFFIASATFTGTDTKIVLESIVPRDITNPSINVSDGPVTFLTVPLPASPVMSGASVFTFKGRDIKNIFRPSTLLKFGNDLYSVISASFDRGTHVTSVQVASVTTNDYTDPILLSSVGYSDCPVYIETTTEVFPVRPIVSVPDTPGLILSQTGSDIIPVSSDASKLTIGSLSFDYTSNPTLGDLSSAIHASALTTLTVGTYAPLWPSREIAPTKTVYLYMDSSTTLSVRPELRLDGTDSTNYTISAAGTIVLDKGLVKSQRYNLDYMGREFLGDTTVSYSANYFVRLPQKSKVQASFEFDNLDQFYIQAMSQKDFFETVSIPRMQNEASQLSGNAGQGGDVPTDEASGNSSGGIADDEFRRKDDEIECRVFKNIYDFFSNRLVAFGQELYAAEGLRLFNNDGVFNAAQQAFATAGVNRIFPNPDWTNFDPERVNPLTGEFVSNGVTFSKGSTLVTSSGALWTKQLPVNADSTSFIGRYRSSTRYRINSITNDSTLVLSSAFTEASTPNPGAGEAYTASTSYPAYDDDGFMGAKIVGTKSKDFGLGDGIIVQDVFDCTIDGVPQSVTFSLPPSLVLIPPPFQLFFWPTFFSASQVAAILDGIPGLSASVEDIVVEPGSTKRTSIVLRTIAPHNVLVIGSGSAVTKLGFTPGAASTGNFDRTLNSPESFLDNREGANIGPVTNLPSNESSDLGTLFTLGIPNKLNRILLGLNQVDDMHTHVGTEVGLVGGEIAQLEAEIGALQVVVQEPTLLSYNDATFALNYAQQFLDQSSGSMPWPCAQTYVYDSSLFNTWETKTADWRWVTDWQDRTLQILGVDSTGDAVDTSTGAGTTPINGQASFILQSPDTGYDLRIVGDFIYDSSYLGPVLKYEKDGSNVPGVWTGWDSPSTTDLFGIRATGFHVFPTYEVTATDIVLRDSTSLIGSVPFSSNPTLQSLITSINAFSGYDASVFFDVEFFPYGGLEVTPQTLLTGSYTPVSTLNQQSVDSSIVFTLNDPRDLIVISPDVVTPSPKYFTSGTSIGFSWTEDEGFRNVNYLYATYPKVSSLMAAIDAFPGFGVYPIHNTNYDYTNLKPLVSVILGGPPGATVYSGPASPAFSMWRDSTYVLNANSLTLDSSVYPFLFYPILGDMSTAVETQPGYTVRSCFAIDYPSGPFVPNAGSVGTVVPGTQLLFANDVSPFGIKMDGTYASPTYQASATDIVFRDGTTFLASLPYSSHTTLQSLVTAVAGLSGFDATLFYQAGAYTYNTLKVVGQTPISNSIYTPVTIQPNSVALAFTADPPHYNTNATAINFHYSGDATRTLPYLTYPTLSAVESAIGALPGMNVVGYFDSSYNFGDLEITSGNLATSGPGTFIHFDPTNPAPLFSVFFNEQNFSYAVDTTALNINWFEDTTASGRTFTYAGFPTVLDMKNAVNVIPGLDATGDVSYDTALSLAFKVASGSLVPDATIYPGLSACDVTYATITDRLLDTRISFAFDRSSELSLRQMFLDQTRQKQITSHLSQEEILRSASGDVGDLWIWANNRWNRRQGCESRLNQIVQQIKSNQSAFAVTKMFL